MVFDFNRWSDHCRSNRQALGNQQYPVKWQPNVHSGTAGSGYLHNTGAAWSMLEGRQWFFAVITVIAIIVVAYLMWKNRRSAWMMTGLSLIMAGAVGNFIDRLSQGYVVDMFALRNVNFPVFNVADACLTVGVFIMLIVVLKEDDHK